MTRFLIAGLLALIVTVIQLVVYFSSLGEQIEPQSLDLLAMMPISSAVPDDIIVVAMDETSYGVLNVPMNQAWPRALHAKLLKRLAEAGVKRVAFDVLFLDQSTDRKADLALAKALTGLPVILGADSSVEDQVTGAGTFKIERVLRPYEPFAEAALTLGLVGLPEDNGYVRRFNTTRTSMTKEMVTLSEGGAGFIEPPKQAPKARDFIKMYGPRGTIPTLSYAQVLDPDRPIADEILKNKVVYVGLNLQTEFGPAQKDIFMTPYGRVFGVEIHATAALNLMYGEWIRRLPRWAESILLAIFCFVLCIGFFLLRPQWGILLLVISIIGWCIITYLGYISNFFVPGFVLVMRILPLAFLGSTLYYYFVTRKAQLKMESAFELYLSPQMAKEVAKNKNALGLGGEKVWATALFTDIAGFTSITEELPAERVSAMLNAYFTEVMDVVFQNDGTLIKFIGDAVFVIWGAPVRINNHAEKACKTALAIQREVARFNQSARFPALHTRIGLNTGPMVVGNLGSAKRFDYTAIGDSVNLASRIEGVNKYFGTEILISGTVLKEVPGIFNTLNVGSICVAGKKEGVELYLLLVDPLPRELTQSWLKMIDYYRNREWVESSKLLEKLTSAESILKKGAMLYKHQIESFHNSPPSHDWQGELVFLEK